MTSIARYRKNMQAIASQLQRNQDRSLMTQLLAGLDVGTSSCKAVVYTIEGDVVAYGRTATHWERTSGRTEISAVALLAAAEAALREAVAAAPDGEIVGVGVTSMGESSVLLDRRDRPVVPVIAWHDTRDTRELEELEAWVSRSEFAKRTGLPLRQQWSITKIRWATRPERQLADVARRLDVAEWIAFSLGAAPVAEQSLASRTGLFDLAARDWWLDGVQWAGGSARWMPEIVTAGTSLGRASVRPGLERLAGATVTVAGHDHQVAAVGVGAVGEGDALDSCGTAEAIVRTIRRGMPAEAIDTVTAAGVTVGWSPLAGRWTLLGGTQGGRALQVILDVVGLSPEEAAHAAAALGAVSSPVRVDAADPEKISITGIDSSTRPGAIWRAAVDDVTEQVAAIDAAMTKAAGPRGDLVITGGWSGDRSVQESKRRRLGGFRVVAGMEAGSRGAALFAGQAAGVYRGVSDFPPIKGGLALLKRGMDEVGVPA
ncbi:FGGY-family carbohydrate kinase [Leifsonia sp. Root227]|uniref:FGGY-family carbohydrate kinase n=1 Tax=Leifsonia sp. Root227 TaxID=1736496 RepID=UPI001EFF4034|nr:FGGY family carbohydrate kinase [Leifsonia sp. Root227]